MFGKIISLIIKYKSVIVIDLIYIIFGCLFCVDILFLINLDVFFFEIVRFCIMFFIFVCIFFGVKEILVWL